MKKFLFLIAAMSLTLTSCLKEDETYKDLPLIYPGVNIYSATLSQHNLSMIPADEGIRLGVLVAERVKQEKPADFDLSKLMYENKVLVQTDLFGSATKIELLDDIYTLTFTPNYQMPSGYFLDGVITVDTNGNESLEDATEVEPWSVDASGLKIQIKSNSGTQSLTTIGGVTELYATDVDTYVIRVMNSRVKLETGTSTSRTSQWSGQYKMKSDAAGLAYSQMVGRKHTVNGGASGDTVFTFNSQGTSTFLVYEVTDGIYQGSSPIVGGVEQATISGEVDPEVYPSKTVKFSWALDGGYRQQTVTYNGVTVTF